MLNTSCSLRSTCPDGFQGTNPLTTLKFWAVHFGHCLEQVSYGKYQDVLNLVLWLQIQQYASDDYFPTEGSGMKVIWNSWDDPYSAISDYLHRWLGKSPVCRRAGFIPHPLFIVFGGDHMQLFPQRPKMGCSSSVCARPPDAPPPHCCMRASNCPNDVRELHGKAAATQRSALCPNVDRTRCGCRAVAWAAQNQ